MTLPTFLVNFTFCFLNVEFSRACETALEHSDDDPKGEALAKLLCKASGLSTRDNIFTA